MKCLLICCFVLIVAFQSLAEVSIGMNFNSRMHNDRQANSQNANNDFSTFEYNLDVQPTAVIVVMDNIEIAPFGGFTFYRQNRYQDDDLTQESWSAGYNLGCGLYFRLIRGDVLRFSLGPQFYFGQTFPGDSDEYSLAVALNAPANIDFCFNDHFFLRASPVLAEISLDYTHINENRFNRDINFNIITQRGLSVGFFFTF
ncbi:MAG: hypothetical protein JXA18_16220 [Chitinispirillaceae bacterium]|nr:hypothetical protein [Chitinispirillaceae bacterium]